MLDLQLAMETVYTDKPNAQLPFSKSLKVKAQQRYFKYSTPVSPSSLSATCMFTLHIMQLIKHGIRLFLFEFCLYLYVHVLVCFGH